MKALQRLVLLAALGLFVAWLVSAYRRLAQGDSDWVVRLVLGLLFALLILLRRKKRRPDERETPGARLALLAGVGMALALVGIIMPVHQLEWVGLLCLLYAAGRWALPPFFARDLFLALFVLYWIHPLPTELVSRMEFGLQMISVKGGERLLQWANQSVWADGSAIYTGLRVFDVDRTCSGLRTATTVLLCVLGAGLLHRMRWWTIPIFGAVGALQVAILNMMRVFFLVWWAPRMPVKWSDTFLHDTLGLFLLTGILLIQVEMSWWQMVSDRRRKAREAVERGEVEPAEKGSFLPHFWVLVFRWAWAIVAVAVLAAGVSLAVYQNRPAHRAALIRQVLDGLIRSDSAVAERAIVDVESLIGTDRELSARRTHILVRQRRFKEALQAIQRIPGELSTREQLLKSWALMGAERPEEAMEVVARLPEQYRESPNIAFFQAEYALRRDLPAIVARNAVLAARSHTTVQQVRAMFPYLASREQWQAIADCQSPEPFLELPYAVMAIQASFRVGRLAAAADVLREAMGRWPDDPRLLGSIYEMAVRGQGGDWEERFAQGLQAALPTLDADRLASYLSYSFRLHRPDLAWKAYRRLAERDPADPALALAVVQFGPSWFTFRKHFLGIRAADKRETLDLAPEFRKKKNAEEFQKRWGTVPMADELLTNRLVQVRSHYMDVCLAELERREKAGQMSRRLDSTYPVVLGLAGRYDEAHQRLTALEKKYPDERADAMIQRAVLYDRRGQWSEAYELLRGFDRMQPTLLSRLLMANALINLNQGVGAMQVAAKARREFPESAMAGVAEAAVWDVFGFKEEALFVLEQTGAEKESPAYVQLLYDTGRFGEAKKASQALGIRIQEEPGKAKEGLVLPAEFTLMRRWPQRLSAEAMSREAAALEQQADRVSSPFVARLLRLESAWHRSGGNESASDPAVWMAVGRDNRERANALHRLTLLLGLQGRYSAAEDSIRRALEFMPDSAVLWRVWIALTEGAGDVVDRAAVACPDDADIWLASLIRRVRAAAAAGGPPAGAGKAKAAADGNAWVAEMEAAVRAGRFSPGAMVRASDFLLRHGHAKAAAVAARDAIERGQGLLSAYVAGLRCAVATRDLKWARQCALGGVDNALEARPFQEMIVNLSFAEKTMDADLLTALEYLRKKYPQDAQWSERLGFVYFQKGDPIRALNVLGPLIRADAKGLRADSLIIAAESARIEGKPEVGIRILEAANAMYPGNLSILNNLVYCLAQDPHTLPRARALLPELLKLESDSFVVQDTAAMVHFRSGQLDDAEINILRALQSVDEKNYAALEVKMNAAEIFLARGRVDVARNMIEPIVKNPKCPKPVEARGRDLLRQVAQAKLNEDLADATRLYQARKYDEALALLKRILLDPNCSGDVEKGAGSLLRKVAEAKSH